MIMIDGQWEDVVEIEDVLRVVNEKIGSEFAQCVKEIYNYDTAENWREEYVGTACTLKGMQQGIDDMYDASCALHEMLENFLKVLKSGITDDSLAKRCDAFLTEYNLQSVKIVDIWRKFGEQSQQV